MSQSTRIPSYRRHKQSGQAIVTLPDGLGGRRDILHGKYGTATSRAEYARVISEWEASGRCLAKSALAAADLTINELVLAYWRFVLGSEWLVFKERVSSRQLEYSDNSL